MNGEGFRMGRYKTARLMKLAGVGGCRCGSNPVSTISPETPERRLDPVQRNFREEVLGGLGSPALLTSP